MLSREPVTKPDACVDRNPGRDSNTRHRSGNSVHGLQGHFRLSSEAQPPKSKAVGVGGVLREADPFEPAHLLVTDALHEEENGRDRLASGRLLTS